MNNFKFLLLGTSLSFIPLTVNAQCVATQDCATLGYTETSCNGGKGVKCPFGNKWACFKSDFDVCQKYGFTQTCTGEGQTGVGNACNGKYSECKCNDGYTWDDSLKMCKTNCVIGALYYSDGICLPYKISTKTVIGVVIYEKNTDENGWIMTIEPVKKGIDWGGKANNFPGLDNCTSESCLTDVQSSCINTDIITEYCDKSVCPVAWVAKDYKFGTTSGQNWCLPSGGLLNVSLIAISEKGCSIPLRFSISCCSKSALYVFFIAFIFIFFSTSCNC